MSNLNLHILTPNKFDKRYFGVDYFMNILTGHNPLFKYYSTSIDHNPVFTEGPTTFLPEMYDFLTAELDGKAPGTIIGIQNNPDIYTGVDSLKKLLDILKIFKMGLYLETSSMKVIDDLPYLKEFAKELPLLLAIPAATTRINSNLFGKELMVEHAAKIIQKVKSQEIFCGLLVKPIVPFINDDVEDFKGLVSEAIAAGVDFIYPSFSIKFDSKKVKAFYDVIDIECPELMNRFKDDYGQKKVWESPNISELKKQFVILTRKHKVLYSMKDIINTYKPDLNIQLKLF